MDSNLEGEPRPNQVWDMILAWHYRRSQTYLLLVALLNDFIDFFFLSSFLAVKSKVGIGFLFINTSVFKFTTHKKKNEIHLVSSSLLLDFRHLSFSVFLYSCFCVFDVWSRSSDLLFLFTFFFYFMHFSVLFYFFSVLNFFFFLIPCFKKNVP